MNAALRKDLRAIHADGTAYSVMVGIGENYLPAFVLALSADQLASGLVSTVPLVVGAVLQLVSPWAVERLGSYRRWVTACAAVQAVSFVPLLAAALMGAMPLWLVFAAAAVYFGTNLAGAPAWNAWVDTLVPSRLRARYFARRTRLSQFGLVVGFVAGGLMLQAATKLDVRLTAFALLFAVAATARLASARFLWGQREPAPPNGRPELPPLWRWRAVLRAHATGPTLLYLLAAQAAVQIASPYFTPYMLRQLELSYAGYVVLTCIAYVAKIACLPALGRLADRWGPHRLLWIGGLAIVPVAGLWNFSNSFGYLCGVQVFSGAAWGAYELAMLLLFFEALPGDLRVGVLTVFNLANSTAILAGSLMGGALLAALGAGRQAYLTLFLVSSVARAAALPLLAYMPKAAVVLQAKVPTAVEPPASMPLSPHPVAQPVVASADDVARPRVAA